MPRKLEYYVFTAINHMEDARRTLKVALSHPDLCEGSEENFQHITELITMLGILIKLAELHLEALERK